jgi:molybdopterin molybdotransferase
MTGGRIELDDARRAVLSHAGPLAPETVVLKEALGRQLAEDVVAEAAVHPFDNSAMDGFALRAADTTTALVDSPVVLQVIGESRAGHPPGKALRPGEAMSISTGAAMPPGADTVVRREEARRENGRVLIGKAAAPGRDVRRCGEDIAAGSTVLFRGQRLGPAELGVLAALGHESPRCHRRPQVAVVTSGDELVPPGEGLLPGGVYDSSSISVPALATMAGAEIASLTWAPDEPAATRDAIDTALDADVAVVCGGVSVGEHDHVRPALERLGVDRVFWGIALKPGGPAWFGTSGDTLVFGLPGNPVSAMVVFILLVRPALLTMAGGDGRAPRVVATLAAGWERQAERVQALRCGLELSEEGWRARPAPRQGSHLLTSMLGADCLALIPAGRGEIAAGERVEVELLCGGGVPT